MNSSCSTRHACQYTETLSLLTNRHSSLKIFREISAVIVLDQATYSGSHNSHLHVFYLGSFGLWFGVVEWVHDKVFVYIGNQPVWPTNHSSVATPDLVYIPFPFHSGSGDGLLSNVCEM